MDELRENLKIVILLGILGFILSVICLLCALFEEQIAGLSEILLFIGIFEIPTSLIVILISWNALSNLNNT